MTLGHVAALVLALIAGTPSNPLVVVDESGAPVAGAQVVFISAARARDTEHTDAAGRANAPSGFVPIEVDVSKTGYTTASFPLPRETSVVLVRALPVIGSVRVATGTLQSLHVLPVAATVLDRAAIRANPAATGDALMSSLAGFDRQRSNSLFTNYGQLRVSFAGAGTDRGLVLADGFPAQDGFGGQVDWAAYPPNDVERAELLLGAGSALYGPGAVGGALDIQTFSPANAAAQPEGEASFEAGTYDRSEQWVNARARVAPRLAVAAALQQQRLSYWDLPPAYQSLIDHIATGAGSMAALRVRYDASADTFVEAGVRGAWDEQDEGRPNYSFSRRFAQTDLRIGHSGAQSLVQGGVYLRGGTVFNNADQYPTLPGVPRYRQTVPTDESGAFLQWTAGPSSAQFELRADARNVRGLSQQVGGNGSFQNSGSGNQVIYGAGVQETLRAKRFEFVAGARFDGITSYDLALNSATANPPISNPPSKTDSAISPRIALRFDALPHLALRASLGSGLRAPFLNELVRGFFIGATAFVPNPSLVPERSHTASFGADLADAKRRLSFDGFETVVNDAIMFVTVAPNRQMRSNVARTQTDGYTATYAQALGPCARLSASATSQYARVTAGPAAIAGKRLAYVPSRTATLGYTARVGEIGTGVTLSYMGPTFADDVNTQPLGTAVVLGASAHVPMNGAWLDFTVQNATGARYLSSVDRYAPPAVVSIGFRLPLQQNGDAVEAPPRC